MKKVIVRFETVDEFMERTKKELLDLEAGKLEVPSYGLSFDPTNLPAAFTRKRVELLMAVANKEVKSIRKLSDILGRDYKSVYNDAKILEKMGLLKLEKQGKAKSPVQISMNIDKMVLDFGESAEA